SAVAPPLTLTLSWGMPSSRMGAMATTEKASLTSNRSTSSAFQPTLSSRLRIALTGAVVNHSGSWENVAWPTILAIGSSPSLAALSALVSTVAAAPSEMLEELAAVTVPSLRKAGRRPGILDTSERPGCSSVSYSTSPLRVDTLTGTISSLNAPDSIAAFARFTDSMVNASCSSRVKPYLSAVASANTPIDWPS